MSTPVQTETTRRATPAPLGPALGSPVEPAPEDKPLRKLKHLGEARHARAFRKLLARRGIEPKLLYTAPADLFTCAPCFEAAIASLGWVAERMEPTAFEEGLVEGYERASWHFEAETPDEDDVCVVTLDLADVAAEDRHEARFRADERLGLFRIREPDRAVRDALWVWTYDQGGEAAWVATDDRERLRPLLTALHRADRDHQRQSGLVLIGNRSEARARRVRATWEDLVLPAAIKTELQGAVRGFFAAAELYRRHGIPHRRGLLLAGPPGNGKTSIVRVIASELDVPVVVATLDGPHDVYNTRNAFKRAVDLAPAVVCLEDIDALVGDGPGLSQFLNLLDGLEPLEGVLVVATTNRPDRIDPAIARRPSRFDRVFVIPEPDPALRREYLAKQLGPDGPTGAAGRLAAATEGYSVAFLKELVLQARLAAVRRGEERVTDADLDAALATTQEHLRLASRGLESRGELGF